MTKKQKQTKVEVTEPQIQNVVETPQVVKQPETVVKEKPLPTPKKDTWEVKDRFYMLKSNDKPLSKLL